MATALAPTILSGEKDAQHRTAALGLALAQAQIKINRDQNTLNARWAEILHKTGLIPGEPPITDGRTSVHAALLTVREYAHDELYPSGPKPDAGNYATLSLHLRDAIAYDNSPNARNLYPMAERAIQVCEDQSDLIHLRESITKQWGLFQKQVEASVPHYRDPQIEPLSNALCTTYKISHGQIKLQETSEIPHNQDLFEACNLLRESAPQLKPATLEPPEMQDPVWNMTNRSAMFFRMAQATERGLIAFPITRREDAAYLMDTIYGQGYGATTLKQFEAAAMKSPRKSYHKLGEQPALPGGLHLAIHIRNSSPYEYTVIVPKWKNTETARFLRRATMCSENHVTQHILARHTPIQGQARKRHKPSIGIER